MLVLKSKQGNPVTNSVLVAQKFGKQHKHVIDSIKQIIRSAENSAHYFYLSTYTDTNNRKHEMYVMNRDGFSLLVMGFTGPEALKFKIEFIDAFNKMENELKKTSQVPQTFSQALRLAAEQAEQLELQATKIKEMEPKAVFADSVSASSNSILIANLAKLLRKNGVRIGQNRLYEWLRENKYLCSALGSHYNMPTQMAMDLELFDISETVVQDRKHNTTFVKFTTKVTGKGQVYFINKLVREKIISSMQKQIA